MHAAVLGVLWAFVCAFAIAVPANAQIIRGKVFLPDSVSPAAGIVVTAINGNGVVIASDLSRPTGAFALQLPRPGRYDLRLLRIGYRPMVVAGLEIGAVSLTERDVVLELLPVNIAGLEVRGRADCSLRGRDAEMFLRLWEQARAALIATRLSDADRSLKVHLMRLEGKADAMRYYAPSVVGEPEPEWEVATYRDWIADRVFATTAADTLEQAGYVRRRHDGTLLYDVPNPDALLSDAFLAEHCVAVVRAPRDHQEWVGIAFTPRRERAELADVEGVVWLDRKTAELRRIEFTYTNLPHSSHRLCTTDGSPERRSCVLFEEKGLNRFGVGGDADYVRLGTGEWLVSRLSIGTVSDEMVMRPSARTAVHGYPKRECDPAARIVRQAPRGGECTLVNWPVPRLTLLSTRVLRLVRDGVEVFRSDSAIAESQSYLRRGAGDERLAIVSGVMLDDIGRPLRAAEVRVHEPLRSAALTDTLGRFSLSAPRARQVVVAAYCAGYQPVRFSVQPRADSTQLTLKMERVGNDSTRAGRCAR